MVLIKLWIMNIKRGICLKINEIYELMKKKVGVKCLLNESMKKYTSFKIGGVADLIVLPNSIEQISEIIKLCNKYKINYIVLGNGTNVLINDQGIRDLVIKIDNNFNALTINENKIIAQAGCLLPNICNFVLDNSVGGMEELCGIPGTIGGAIVMNAGAFGVEMKDIVTKIKCLNKFGEIIQYTNREMNFKHRYSNVIANKLIVLEVEIDLKKEKYETIKRRMNLFKQKRLINQPISLPSAGCIFKRPQNDFASRLIEDAGLKGTSCGGAQVSSKHSGYIVNTGNATSEDVLKLIKIIQETIMEKFNIKLETEIKII